MYVRRSLSAGALTAVALLGLVFHEGPVSAQSPRQVVVTAPIVQVEIDTNKPPTEGYNLDISIANAGDDTMETDVRLVEGPDGWQASLYHRVSAIAVNRVQVPAQGSINSLNFHFVLPPRTENGTYTFVLGFFDESGAGVAEVAYTVSVNIPQGQATSGLSDATARVLPGGFEFEAEFSKRTARLGEAITFAVILSSLDVGTLTLGLGADAPPGWQVVYRPSSQAAQVGAISLSGGGTESLEVEVTPPPNTRPGVHPVVLRASPEGLDPIEVPLEVELTGVPDLNLTTESGLLTAKATAGEATDLTVLVVNSGEEGVDNVRFLSDAPPKWTVNLDQNPVPRVEAGSTVELIVSVTPPEETIPGDYNFRILTAVAGESSDLQFRVTVVRSSAFGFIGVGIILLVVAGLGILFVRLGRR